MKIIRKLAILLLALLSVMICVCAVYYQIVTSGTRLQPELLQTPTETAAVLDRNGDEIADISLKNANRNARLEELPAHVRQAFIASEDKNFYRHHGLDYGGMARALLKNLRARSFRQGASTISNWSKIRIYPEKRPSAENCRKLNWQNNWKEIIQKMRSYRCT